jgi:hypothetical protein
VKRFGELERTGKEAVVTCLKSMLVIFPDKCESVCVQCRDSILAPPELMYESLSLDPCYSFWCCVELWADYEYSYVSGN